MSATAAGLIGKRPVMDDLAQMSLAEMVQRVASAEPTPGAGPSLAWTCGLAAALVEMVSAVTIRQDPSPRSEIERRRDRATELRHLSLSVADTDADAYRKVLAVQQRREEPGHAARLREALHAAADPLVTIVETAGEVTRLAADAYAEVRGGARGEAVTAAVLGAAVAQTAVALVELNLAGAPEDPRLARVRHVSQNANSDRQRVLTD